MGIFHKTTVSDLQYPMHQAKLRCTDTSAKCHNVPDSWLSSTPGTYIKKEDLMADVCNPILLQRDGRQRKITQKPIVQLVWNTQHSRTIGKFLLQ